MLEDTAILMSTIASASCVSSEMTAEYNRIGGVYREMAQVAARYEEHSPVGSPAKLRRLARQLSLESA